MSIELENYGQHEEEEVDLKKTQDRIENIVLNETCEYDTLLSSTESPKSQKNCAIKIESGNFLADKYFYEKTLNSKAHPVVKKFFNLNNEAIIKRYTQTNPKVNVNRLRECLSYQPKYFKWAGCDLFYVTNNEGKRQMIIIESNSCPSGQKSMPFTKHPFGGYKQILEQCLKEVLDGQIDKNLGELAVLYDQNSMESSGFAKVLAELSQEHVWLVAYYDDEETVDTAVRWDNDGMLSVRDENNNWHPIRACLRYVTQKPWKRIPLETRTLVINPIISCLAGGRNKIMAAHAYEAFNRELRDTGISIRTPHTVLDLSKHEIPDCIAGMGGKAVIKVPYGNCGDGVYTITNQTELNKFLDTNHFYTKFLVQSLVGNISWSMKSENANNEMNYYHIGTVPNERNEVFVFDLRMVVTANESGFLPVSINGRSARKPILTSIDEIVDSWEILGTNLSVKKERNLWDTESKRVLLMDTNDFEHIGIGIDDLIDGYIQTILSVISIDKFCAKLLKSPNEIDKEVFKQLNCDENLINEI